MCMRFGRPGQHAVGVELYRGQNAVYIISHQPEDRRIQSRVLGPGVEDRRLHIDEVLVPPDEAHTLCHVIEIWGCDYAAAVTRPAIGCIDHVAIEMHESLLDGVGAHQHGGILGGGDRGLRLLREFR